MPYDALSFKGSTGMTAADPLFCMTILAPSVDVTSLDSTTIPEEVIPAETICSDKKKNDTERTPVFSNGTEKKLSGSFTLYYYRLSVYKKRVNL